MNSLTIREQLLKYKDYIKDKFPQLDYVELCEIAYATTDSLSLLVGYENLRKMDRYIRIFHANGKYYYISPDDNNRDVEFRSVDEAVAYYELML